MIEEEALDMIRARYTQLKEEVDQRSKHKNPMFYAALNNLRWCTIVMELMEGDWPMDNEVAAVCGVKQPRTTQTANLDFSKYIKEGANVMDVLDKYRDTVPDIHDKYRKAIEDAGYVVKGFYICKP